MPGDNISTIGSVDQSTAFQEAVCLAWATILWQYTGCENVILAVVKEDDQTPSATLSEGHDMAVIHLSVKHTLEIGEALNTISSQINNDQTSIASDGEVEYTSIVSFSSKRPQRIHEAASSVWWDGLQKPEAWISPADEWKCAQMLARLEYCTDQICSQPLGPLSGLLGASSTELAVIKEWNQEPLTRHDRCIHHLIKEQARNQPDRPAIESWDGTLTYAELDRISSQYAILLRSNGVGPERFVGIYLYKSRWTAVAILAVLKSGGAFVLLDTSHPIERLKIMCQAVRVSLVLRLSGENSSNFALPGIPILEIGHNDLHEVPQPPKMPAFQSKHTHAAYVAFTSGSTGRPKAFAKLNANFICLTPSVLHLLFPSQMPSLMTLAVTGELMSRELLQRWAPHVQLIITYGPTECSVASSTTHPVQPDTDPRILGSTHNCRFWVVDPNCTELLTPPGAIGELFIEGPIVGRGYINAGPETMAMYGPRRPWLESIPFPDRVYRTGDIVQYTGANGSLRYLGRKDAQVKIRGQRVELGEIEHSIRNEFQNFDSLNLAVETVLFPGKDQNRSLVAFLGNSRASAGENGTLAPPCPKLLQQWDQQIKPSLLQSLPNYMIPAMIVPVARFPFTLSGKTDRKQLQSLFSELSREEVDLYLGVDFVALSPVSPMEATLQKSISETLNIACHKVSMDRSFIELGGDSVDMMRLVSSLREQGIQLSVSDVMSCPNIVSLSETAQRIDITSKLPTTAEPFDLLPKPGGETARKLLSEHLVGTMMDDVADVLPATELQELFFRGPSDYTTMHLKGPVDAVRLEQSCQELVRRHSILRTIFFKHHGRLFQVVLKQPHRSVIHREFTLPASQFTEMLWQEQRYEAKTMDLPVTRFFFAPISAVESLLTIRISHAQYDGDSINSLQRELWSAYRGELKTDPAPDFGLWIHDFLSPTTMPVQEFWKSHLAGSSMTYIGRPFAPRFAKEESFIIIKRIGAPVPPPQGITMASLVKAAWALVLTETVGTQDVIFGQFLSSREPHHNGKDSIVGPCLNIVPVRVNIGTGEIHTVRDLLEAVQDQHARTLPYCRVQLGEISRVNSWPLNTRFGTAVLHNGEEHGEKATIQVDPKLKATVEAYWPVESPPNLRWLLAESHIDDGEHSLWMLTTIDAEKMCEFEAGETPDTLSCTESKEVRLKRGLNATVRRHIKIMVTYISI
ncbi:hypothetical protein DL95DRAFT_416572 [Leptodontidium sp. 2 PMI_412]|nr:hypothetical protein DL95DRAFT_416572 [Leptodontidium sp. 2 PMI_412]